MERVGMSCDVTLEVNTVSFVGEKENRGMPDTPHYCTVPSDGTTEPSAKALSVVYRAPPPPGGRGWTGCWEARADLRIPSTS